MTLKSVKARVRVDWDNDGFLNKGVGVDTPTNLIQSAVTPLQAGLRGRIHDYNFNKTIGVEKLVSEVDELGIVYQQIEAYDNESAFKWAEAGMKGWLAGQVQPDDITNVLTSSAMAYKYVGDNVFVEKMEKYTPSKPARQNPNAPVGANNPPAFTNGFRARGQFKRNLGNFANVSIGSNAAFYDGAANFVTTNNSEVLDMVLQPSTTYHISIWAKISPVTVARKRGAGSTSNIRLTVFYSNGTSNPSVITPTTHYFAVNEYDKWYHLQYSFTTPAVVTRYGFNFRWDTNLSSTETAYYDMFLGGLQVLQLTTFTNEQIARFRESSIKYTEDQFYTILETGTNYNVSFYARQPASTTGTAATKIQVEAYGLQIDGTTITTLLASTDYNIGTDWTRISINLGTVANRSGLLLRLHPKVGSTPSESAVTPYVADFKGFVLNTGTIPSIFHTSEVAAYDDVTDDLISLSWKKGKNDFNEALPFEGVLEIHLNNVDKKYSPNNADSPLYGYLKQNLKVVLEFYNPDTEEWLPKWSGWTDKYEVDPGLYSDRRAIISCTQGINRLRTGVPPSTLFEDVRINEVLPELISASGWKLANTPFQTIVGYDYFTDINAFVQDEDVLFSDIDTGVNRLLFVGQDWGRKTKLDRAVRDLLESENAQLWINSDGSLTMRNRDFWVNRADNAVGTFDVGYYFNDVGYTYGNDVINSVEVTLQPKKTLNNQTLWETKRPIQVAKLSTRDVGVSFDVAEGVRQRTVISAEKDDMTVTLYGRNPTVYETNNEVPTKYQRFITVDLLKDGTGRYTVRVKNKSPITIWANVEIKGSAQDLGDEIGIIINDEDGIRESNGIYREKIDTGILDSDIQAKAMGQALLIRNSSPDGEFGALKLVYEDIDMIPQIFDLEIGNSIIITEAQTGESSRTHVIIAEDGQYQEGVLSVDYTLARLPETRYAVTDQAIAAAETLNLVDHKDVISTNGGVAKDIYLSDAEDKITELQFGAGQSTFFFGLDKSRTYQSIDCYRPAVWPRLDSGGAEIGATAREVTNMNFLHNGKAGMLPVSSSFTLFAGYGYTPNAALLAQITQGIVQGLPAVRFSGNGRRYRLYLTLGSINTLPTSVALRLVNAHNAGIGGGDNTAQRLDTWTDSEGNEVLALATQSSVTIESYRNLQASANKSGMGISAAVVSGTGAKPPVFIADLIDMSGRWGVRLDSAKSYYATFWVRTAPGFETGNSYKIFCYKADGLTIGTLTITPTATLTKYEINLGSGNKTMFAHIRRNTSTPTDYANDRLWVYRFAVTEGQAPNDYLAVDEPNESAALVYV